MSGDPCQPLRDQIDGLERSIASLQSELKTAPPPLKAGLVRMIRDTRRKVGDVQDELRACERLHPVEPPSENVVLTTETCPICTDEQRRIWEYVVTEQLGVDGIDVDGHWIGGFPAERFGVLNINNWYPLAVEKRILCGTLHHFNFFNVFGTFAEADWNNFIIPTPAFQYLIEDAKVHGVTDEWSSCDNPLDCLEAEITPDESYYENVFNSASSNSSALEGQVVCTYGPWVRERVHGNKPEIHPSEMYWWRGELPDGQFAYTLMMVQDDSNRFDREGDYDFGAPWDDPPSAWRPWSENPRTNRFRIAFELNPDGPPLTFRIRRLESLRVHRRWRDATPGKEHGLEYNGKVVLRVEELLREPDHVGVQFGAICRNAENDRLQGYIVLTATVGFGDRGEEGYQTLRVDVDRPPFVTDQFRGDWPALTDIQAPKPLVTIQAEALPETLRREEIDGQPQLVGDVELRVAGRPDATAADLDLAVSAVELVTASGRRQLPHQSIARVEGQQEERSIVRGVVVTDQARLEITTGAGEVMPVAQVELGMAPRITQEAPRQIEDDIRGWDALAAAAGAEDSEIPPPPTLRRTRTWQVGVGPEYGPRHQGQVFNEDDSPFAEALNRVIGTGDARRVNELFGTDAPVEADWSFEATNLATGEVVPVRQHSQASSGEIHVEVGTGNGLDARISATFPEEPADAVFELTATATIRDTFGVEGRLTHRVWSHALIHEDKHELARSTRSTAASLANVTDEDLRAALNLGEPTVDDIGDPPRVMNQRVSRANMLHLAAMAASEDQRVTVDELRSLVQAAAMFREAT